MEESFKIKLIDMLKDYRIIILILVLFISIYGINFSLTNHQGVIIDNVAIGGAAYRAGIQFDGNIPIKDFEQIISINGKPVKNVSDFYNLINNKSQIIIKTNRNEKGYNLKLNKNETNFGLSVREKPRTNIHLGIQFEGGSRFILKPEKHLSDYEYTTLVNTIQNRLDVYGVSGTKVEKLTSPFSKEQLIEVESTSSNKNQIEELINRQGKFTAVLNNVTLFTGDNVIAVSRDSRNTRFMGCEKNKNTSEYRCFEAISFTVDTNASNNFYNVAKKLNVTNKTVSKQIYYYLDGKKIINLSVSSVFKYRKITNQQITFSGTPSKDKSIAIDNLEKETKFLITVLSTKSLPTKLKIVGSYTVSSSMGQKFLHNALLVGLFAILVVALTIAIRYRHLSIFFGIITALLSEIIILLGVSVFMKITIDLAAIGGIIAAIGTGVDDQIIITDEQLRKKNRNLSSRKKMKAAFFIILISYLTTVMAMFPLMFGGLSMLKGFSFMIIVGVTIGVFITRPAYAKYLRIMLNDKSERKEKWRKIKWKK